MTAMPERDSPTSDGNFAEAVVRLGALPRDYFPSDMLRQAFEVACKLRAAVRTEIGA